MAYTVPRAEITQQFLASPIFTDSPLPALILGPNYKLARFAVANEKASTKVVHPTDASKGNTYQSDASVSYLYPDSSVNIDLAYNKVFIEKAQLQVFPNTTLGSPSATVTSVTSFSNRILAAINLKSANGTLRDTVFSNRDVQVGDLVVLSNSVGSDPSTVSKIKSLIATVAPASVGTPTGASGNAGDELALLVTTGTFTASKDITYTLTVERGGEFFDTTNAATCARMRITSNDVDSSPTVNVTLNTFFAVGTYGITAKFTDDGTVAGFVTGDKFFIACTAPAPSTVRTIELEDNLTSNQLASGAALTIAIRLVKSGGTELPVIRSLTANTANWVATATTVTVASGATMTDPAIVQGGVDLVALPVKAGDVYVQYRSLLANYSLSIGAAKTLAEVATKLGVVHVDNPLSQGVYDALLNAADTAVYFGSIPTNDLAGYNKVIELSRKDNRYYSVVPLTFDTTVQDAVVSHVNSVSTPAQAKWRITWLAKQLVTDTLVYTNKPDGNSWLGTISVHPTDSALKIVSVPSATFITDGIRATDSVRYNFRLDNNGAVIYDTVTVAEVRSQTTLILVENTTPVNAVPAKIQVQRNYTTDEQVTNLAAVAGSYNNRRVRAVFPDTYKAGSQNKEGFYLAASLAGLRSGVVPHQGLTNIQLLGPTELPRVVNDLDETQLNTLAAAGIWIVTQSGLGATPYTRHQLTTDESGLTFSEDSITTNVDSISYALQAKLAPFIGLYNVNVGTVMLVRAAIDGELIYRMTNTFTTRAGNQLNGFTITKVEQNPTYKDRIDIEVILQVPAPINVIKLNLTV